MSSSTALASLLVQTERLLLRPPHSLAELVARPQCDFRARPTAVCGSLVALERSLAVAHLARSQLVARPQQVPAFCCSCLRRSCQPLNRLLLPPRHSIAMEEPPPQLQQRLGFSSFSRLPQQQLYGHVVIVHPRGRDCRRHSQLLHDKYHVDLGPCVALSSGSLAPAQRTQGPPPAQHPRREGSDRPRSHLARLGADPWGPRRRRQQELRGAVVQGPDVPAGLRQRQRAAAGQVCLILLRLPLLLWLTERE
eukprot:764850-Hanusia_phi.AAC.8